MVPLRSAEGEESAFRPLAGVLGPRSHAQLTADFKAAVRTVTASGKPEQLCLELLERRSSAAELTRFLDKVPFYERHYWISCVYTALMSARRRNRLAAFFTPPYIVRHVISLLQIHGVDYSKATFVDPACGGGAFLAPIAKQIGVETGLSGSELLNVVREKVAGYELEPRLARLSEQMIVDACGALLSESVGIVRECNSLTFPVGERRFDVVVANPPYGRVFRPSSRIKKRWEKVISNNYVNTYALFTALGLNLVRPGGLVALVLPTSFIGGEYYKAFRAYVRSEADLIALNLIAERDSVFVDVVQDACVLLLRRKISAKGATSTSQPTCSAVSMDGGTEFLGTLVVPRKADAPWMLPTDNGHEWLPDYGPTSILADFGFKARTGSVVWNRSKKDLSALAGDSSFPLIWASDIRVGREIDAGYLRGPATGRTRERYVTIKADSKSISRQAAVVIQRTTNNKQYSRIVAAVVSDDVVEGFGGFAAENHTIVVEPIEGRRPKVTIETLCRILNGPAFDAEFRRMSGTVSVGTRLIEKVPMPNAALIAKDSKTPEGLAKMAQAGIIRLAPVGDVSDPSQG